MRPCTILSGRRRATITACALLLGGAAPPVSIAPVDARFTDDASAYALIWQSDGRRIVAALEAAAGLDFPQAPIDIIVSDARPMASYDGRLIRLRASYSPAYKKATLVHELGHRLAFVLPRTDALDDHRLLYLFLYDAWTALWGREFAERMVAIERRIPGAYDYDAAWTWALSQSREDRQARLRTLRAERGPDRPAESD